MHSRGIFSIVALGVAAAILTACGGHAGVAPSVPADNTPLSQQSVAFMTALPSTEYVGGGQIHNGVEGIFSPADGDSSTGGHGPLNSTLDGIQCASTMANSGYHIHFFLGIVRNGYQYALPDAIGFANPTPNATEITYNGVPNQEEYVVPPPGQRYGCYYRMHTHDPSGVVHVEMPQAYSIKSSVTKLGQFFAVWGHHVTTSSFDTLGGPVRIVTSGQRFEGGTSSGRIANTTYSYYSGDPNQIAIYSHEVIWLLIGSGNPGPQQLPSIVYYEEY